MKANPATSASSLAASANKNRFWGIETNEQRYLCALKITCTGRLAASVRIKSKGRPPEEFATLIGFKKPYRIRVLETMNPFLEQTDFKLGKLSLIEA